MDKNNEFKQIMDQFIADCRKLHENGESVAKVAELLCEEKYHCLWLIPDGTPASKYLFKAFDMWNEK